ncbi:uncharacterized protein LOC6566369 [Drosophila grimshawi]|uniref:GH24428 n=1 Tax=Drosophila grimshawi TaxID=7222 RepID=B4JLZ4_DROGR|nr:uncharacterized protein LOC6566369 [Drosophila grimshawi]XP_032594784.1 uncharacterized protein LOC6566369 [Drosophila grimshawi]XP_032594785.1 uncharacterized protein LOC6566369 [Drosophila grimshawi]EDV91755.1 GH24428 [Drosophila grimshawi]
MSRSRASINIFAPSVCPFPELNAFASGYRRPEMMLKSPLPADKRAVAAAVAEATVAAIAEEVDGREGGNGQSLYVINSQGQLLEHVRYQGSDYRGALLAAINATPPPLI